MVVKSVNEMIDEIEDLLEDLFNRPFEEPSYHYPRIIRVLEKYVEGFKGAYEAWIQEVE